MLKLLKFGPIRPRVALIGLARRFESVNDVGRLVAERAMRGQSILVTGAAGLIGHTLCRKLRSAGVHVTEIDFKHSQLNALTDNFVLRPFLPTSNKALSDGTARAFG